MNIDEFESQYRISIETSLNQLQAANLLLVKLKIIVARLTDDLQKLTVSLEEHKAQQENK